MTKKRKGEERRGRNKFECGHQCTNGRWSGISSTADGRHDNHEMRLRPIRGWVATDKKRR